MTTTPAADHEAISERALGDAINLQRQMLAAVRASISTTHDPHRASALGAIDLAAGDLQRELERLRR